MRAFLAFLVLALSTLTAVHADNKYPVVLVHGFAGWGRDELLGLKYWGGLQGDLESQLKAQGYTVYTAAVGPFSSNWDRACELYAQIKGGRVDYGIKHAIAHNHTRHGRNFTGLYPQWGNVVDGKVNKVHLFGHSMGGQTIRMLAQMLAKGTKGSPTEEDAATHPLFAGGKDWVHSITTISSPNQGTLLANGFSEIGDLVKDLIVGVFGLLGVGGDLTQNIYDVKMDQWGIAQKKSTETLTQYIKRVFDTPLFKPGFKDICLWSLSTDGAKEESKWVETLSNVYYYSYANEDTYAWRDLLLRRIELPNLVTMLLPLQPLAAFIGSRYGPDKGFSTDWLQNDGVVDTVSMSKDYVGTSRTFDGYSTIGKWNTMPLLSRMDHLAVTGLTLHTQVKALYMAHIKLLAGLPTSSTTSRNLEGTTASTPASVDTVYGLMNAVSSLNEAAESTRTHDDLKALCERAVDKYSVNYCQSMLNQNNRALRG